MVRKCPKCGSSRYEHDASRGDTVCTGCGAVLEENVIISEVQFADSGSGQSSVIGQFLPATSMGSGVLVGGGRLAGTMGFAAASGNAGVPSAGLYGQGQALLLEQQQQDQDQDQDQEHPHQQQIDDHQQQQQHFIVSESREETIERGRKRIQQMASLLKLTVIVQESAHRIFIMALQQGFLQGRRSEHVVASCLYVACRRERTPHMLLDFSEITRCNMFTLAATFSKLVRLLQLRLPLVDPSLFIHRFAAEMELGPKAHEVAVTSLKLIAQMRRDWLQTGRRPTGLCAAALLIASRMHGFRRTQQDILECVRICDQTLRLRLREFQNTGAAMNMTGKEFAEVEDIHQIPLIVRRKKLSSLGSDSPGAAFAHSQLRHLRGLGQQGEEPQEEEDVLEGFDGDSAPPSFVRARMAELGDSAEGDSAAVSRSPSVVVAMSSAGFAIAEDSGDDVGSVEEDSRDSAGVDGLAVEMADGLRELREKRTDLSAALSTPTAAGAMSSSATFSVDEIPTEAILNEIDDKEIEGYLVSAATAELRERIWSTLNASYLSRKRQQREAELAVQGATAAAGVRGGGQPSDVDGAGAAQELGTASAKKMRILSSSSVLKEPTSSVAESIRLVMEKKKLSSRIDLNAMERFTAVAGLSDSSAPTRHVDPPPSAAKAVDGARSGLSSLQGQPEVSALLTFPATAAGSAATSTSEVIGAQGAVTPGLPSRAPSQRPTARSASGSVTRISSRILSPVVSPSSSVVVGISGGVGMNVGDAHLADGSGSSSGAGSSFVIGSAGVADSNGLGSLSTNAAAPLPSFPQRKKLQVKAGGSQPGSRAPPPVSAAAAAARKGGSTAPRGPAFAGSAAGPVRGSARIAAGAVAVSVVAGSAGGSLPAASLAGTVARESGAAAVVASAGTDAGEELNSDDDYLEPEDDQEMHDDGVDDFDGDFGVEYNEDE